MVLHCILISTCIAIYIYTVWYYFIVFVFQPYLYFRVIYFIYCIVWRIYILRYFYCIFSHVSSTIYRYLQYIIPCISNLLYRKSHLYYCIPCHIYIYRISISCFTVYRIPYALCIYLHSIVFFSFFTSVASGPESRAYYGAPR